MSYSSVHFIHTIIGGMVEKIPNVGTRGRPASRFKDIGYIYFPEVDKSIGMPLVVGGRVTRRSHRRNADCVFVGEVASGSARNLADNKSCNDSDQHDVREITLKEIKDGCKAKKRKVSKSIDCTEQDIDISRKRDPRVQIKEEHSDLEETLSCLKQKLSKKSKVKRKHTRKQFSPESACSVKDEEKCSSFSVLAEDSMLNGPSHTVESFRLTKIKTEIVEIDSCDHQNVVCNDNFSPASHLMKINSFDDASEKLLDRVGGDMVTKDVVSSVMKVDAMDSAAELPVRIGFELDRGEPTFSSLKSQDCCISEVSTQYLEPSEPVDILGAMPKIGCSETTSQGSLPFPTSELKLENARTHLISFRSAGSLFSPKDLDSEVNGCCQNHSSSEEKHCNAVTEMHDLAIVDLCCTELDNGRDISDLLSEGLQEIVHEVLVECEKSAESIMENAYDPFDHPMSHGSHSSLPDVLCHEGDNAVTQMRDMDIDHSIQSMGLYGESDTRAAGLESNGLGVSGEVSMDREMLNNENTIPDVGKEDSAPCHENTTKQIDDFYTPSESSDPCSSVVNNFSYCNSNLPMNDNATQMCDVDINDSIQSMRLYDESDTCASALKSKDLGISVEVFMDKEMPEVESTVPDVSKEVSISCHESTTEKIDDLHISSQNSDRCFGVDSNVHSCNSTLPMTEKMLSSPTMMETMAATVEEARDSFTKLTASPTNELMETYICSLKPTHPPENLLSTRKVISPMSQEKLRQAVEDDESRDKIKVSKNGNNLGYEKWPTNKVSSRTCFEEAEFMIKKPKNRKNGCPPVVNDTVKAPHLSCLTSCSCVECTWISEHSQKAITFSQRQMHDIESLASRLVNGLKSMKDIIKDTLLSEACMSLPSKYTVSEINEAMKEANVLEDSTRKWLTMMTKDCNRFCKIMTSTTDKPVTKESDIHKDQKKVIFADEIGGVLCHVKILEAHSTFA